ncbi:hypothetical protein ACFLWG_00190 [Chloroflexota bacterium]
MDKVNVIKIGGAVFDSCDTTIDDVVHLQQQGKCLVVIHGGASMVTDWFSRQRISCPTSPRLKSSTPTSL